MLEGTKCREPECGQYLVWLKTAKGANMPVEVESLDAADDESTMFDSTRHEAHWNNCVNARTFRKEKPKAKVAWKYLRVAGGGLEGEVAIGISGDRVRIRYAGKTKDVALAEDLAHSAQVQLWELAK